MRIREWLVGRTVKGGPPKSMDHRTRAEHHFQRAGPAGPQSITPTIDHESMPSLRVPFTVRHPDATIRKSKLSPGGHECALTTPSPAVSEPPESSPSLQASGIAGAGRLLCHPGWSGGGCAGLVRHRGALMARPGGYRSGSACGLRSRTAAGCEGEAVDLRRRAQECGREPSPHNEQGFPRRRPTRAKPVSLATEEVTSSSWRRGGRGKDDPCGSHRARRHGELSTWWPTRSAGHGWSVPKEQASSTQSCPRIVDNTGYLGDLATISSPLEIDHLGIDLGQQERAPTIMIGARKDCRCGTLRQGHP